MARLYCLAAVAIGWAGLGVGSEPGTTGWEIRGERTTPRALEIGESRFSESSSTKGDAVKTGIVATTTAGPAEQQRTESKLGDRDDDQDIRIANLEKILDPLQMNIAIFLAIYSLIMVVLGVLVGLGAKVGFAWFRRRFRQEQEIIQKQVSEAIAAASASIEKKAESLRRDVDLRLYDTINHRVDYLNALVRDVIAWTLEWLAGARRDADILRARDVFSALMLTESEDPRNVRNGCLVLQNLHRRGYRATSIARPRLDAILRRWVGKAEKARTKDEKKGLQSLIKELKETIHELSTPTPAPSGSKKKIELRTETEGPLPD